LIFGKFWFQQKYLCVKEGKGIAEKSMFCGKIERKKWQVEMDIVEIILPVTNSILVTKL